MAEAVEDIAFGTAKGPMRFGLLFLVVISAASTMVRVEAPPEGEFAKAMALFGWTLPAGDAPV